MSALHSILRDRLHHAEVAVEAASRAQALALEEAAEAGLSVPGPTAQVPVLLREQVQALRDEMFAECDSEDHLVPLVLLIERLDALLSQPTPTAEPKPLNPDSVQRVLNYHGWPPRPEGMAPGTTFVYLSGLWEVVDGGDALLRNGPGGGITYRTLSQFDPSTIRDVVVPS